MEPTQAQILDLEIQINQLQIRMLQVDPKRDYDTYKAIQTEYARLCREKQQLTSLAK